MSGESLHHLVVGSGEDGEHTKEEHSSGDSGEISPKRFFSKPLSQTSHQSPSPPPRTSAPRSPGKENSESLAPSPPPATSKTKSNVKQRLDSAEDAGDKVQPDSIPTPIQSISEEAHEAARAETLKWLRIRERDQKLADERARVASHKRLENFARFVGIQSRIPSRGWHAEAGEKFKIAVYNKMKATRKLEQDNIQLPELVLLPPRGYIADRLFPIIPGNISSVVPLIYSMSTEFDPSESPKQSDAWFWGVKDGGDFYLFILDDNDEVEYMGKYRLRIDVDEATLKCPVGRDEWEALPEMTKNTVVRLAANHPDGRGHGKDEIRSDFACGRRILRPIFLEPLDDHGQIHLALRKAGKIPFVRMPSSQQKRITKRTGLFKALMLQKTSVTASRGANSRSDGTRAEKRKRQRKKETPKKQVHFREDAIRFIPYEVEDKGGGAEEGTSTAIINPTIPSTSGTSNATQDASTVGSEQTSSGAARKSSGYKSLYKEPAHFGFGQDTSWKFDP